MYDETGAPVRRRASRGYEAEGLDYLALEMEAGGAYVSPGRMPWRGLSGHDPLDELSDEEFDARNFEDWEDAGLDEEDRPKRYRPSGRRVDVVPPVVSEVTVRVDPSIAETFAERQAQAPEGASWGVDGGHVTVEGSFKVWRGACLRCAEEFVQRRPASRHRAGDEPQSARDRVIDEAVQTFAATGRWTSDVGERASAAFADGMPWEAERLALRSAVEFTETCANDAFEAFAPDALAHLAGRLASVLSDALAASGKLGGARSADDAIKAGGDAVEAWGRLQGCVSAVTNVRAAQWALLTPKLRRHELPGSNEQRNLATRWRSAGHGEVRGARADDVPEFVRDAARSKGYSVASVLWLAESGAAYVPESFEELAEEVELATPAPIVYDDHGPVRDMSPIETVIPTPKAADVYPHSRTPQIDFSGPTPKNPTPNATPGDPAPPVWR
ncbi:MULTISPECIES: hypothetical protein [Streptomyces]|uniref:Uncharacterized protein n=1 Tax=Streptomyces viridochromogenes TaxID=1938 RepID=A0A0L8JCJ8_STRVR|nr:MULTISPECIES: hypothetical protein [Streptomyces]KOG11356.1 hypothetical protein ADK34_34355 [Streptomyces viridochromogenes]